MAPSEAEQQYTPPKTTLLVVRHGETEWNVERRFQGQFDSPLTDTGRAQAAALGQRLQNCPFDELIASDLGRARETAAIIAEQTGHVVQTDNRLRERGYGLLEGLTLPEIKTRHADVLAALYAGDPDYVIPDGESLREHYRRNVDFIEAYLARRAGSIAALVVHGGVLESIFRYVARLSLDHPRCIMANNASLSVVSHGLFYGAPRWVIETWGEVGHLGATGCQLGL